jgi:dihydroxyacid dehydratase/phosphogluconate dehydratase
MTSTLTLLRGNLAPEGALVKSTAISPALIGPDGIYRHEGPARVFTTESAAIAAVKAGRLTPGDVLVLAGIGPGIGMPETYQITSALKYVRGGERIALVTDGRFSGVSTGACIGHVSPEAWAGGPLGGVRDGDRIRLVVDTRRLEGSVDAPDLSAEALRARGRHPGLRPDPRVPADTRLWSALQQACGGTWAGCVHDADRIARLLELGLAAERAQGDRPAG